MEVKISELLLLFIYLEIITMVIIYMDSGQIPVRIPLYIAMVALARYLILDLEDMSSYKMLAISAAVLAFALAVYIVRLGQVKLPDKNLSE